MTAQMHDSIHRNDEKFSILESISASYSIHLISTYSLCRKYFFLRRSSFFSFPLPAPLPSFHNPPLSPLLMELSRSMKFLPAAAGKRPASVCVRERSSRSSLFRVKSRMENQLSLDLAVLVGHVKPQTAVSPCPLNSVMPWSVGWATSFLSLAIRTS